jgi:hypothetical protein
MNFDWQPVWKNKQTLKNGMNAPQLRAGSCLVNFGACEFFVQAAAVPLLITLQLK